MRWAVPLLTVWVLVACTRTDPYETGEAAYAQADFEAARAAYEAALRESPTPRARIQSRLGLTLRKLGDLPGSEAMLRDAVDGAEAGGDAHLAAVSRRYLGRTLANAQRHDEAMAEYAAALAHHEAHGPVSDLLKLQLQRAALAWHRRDFDTAYGAYLDIHGRATVGGHQAMEGHALQGLSMLMVMIGEFDEARALLTRAIRLHREAGRAAAVTAALVARAAASVRGGRHEAARHTAEQALKRARTEGARDQAVAALLVLVYAHVDGGRAAEALVAARAAREAAVELGQLVKEAWLAESLALVALERWDEADAALETTRTTADPNASQETPAWVAALSATVAEGRGDEAAALKHLRAAVRAFEALRTELRAAPMGAFFHGERARAYERLVSRTAAAGAVSEALRTVGQTKARALSETLLATDSGGERRRKQRGDNLVKLLPGLPAMPDPAALVARLPRELTVIEYFALPDRLLVFRIRGGEIELRKVPVARAELEQRVRAMLAAVVRGSADWTTEAAWLAERLLDPVDAALREAPGPVAFVPHGALHHVPFAALPWGDGLLVDTIATFSAPSLVALDSVLQRPAAVVPPRVLTVGDPRDDLPGARAEVKAVAAGFASSTMLLGASATESAVRGALGGAALSHFAVHGIRTSPNRPAHLALLEDSAHDGRLHADEIAAMELPRSLVVLSVCDSAHGTPNQGDELVGVVDRAFLAAGARTVLASRWPVHDAASVLFMRRFYAELPTRGVLGAFNEAQRTLRSGRARTSDLGPTLLAQLGAPRVQAFRGVQATPRVVDLRHPYFWAAFTLRGDYR